MISKKEVTSIARRIVTHEGQIADKKREYDALLTKAMNADGIDAKAAAEEARFYANQVYDQINELRTILVGVYEVVNLLAIRDRVDAEVRRLEGKED